MRQKLVIICVPMLLLALAWLNVIDLERLVGHVRYLFYGGKGLVQNASVSRPPATRNTQHAALCRQNLTRIQNAKRKAAFDRGRAVGLVTWEETVQAMYPEKGRSLTPREIQLLYPRCPSGGTYALGSLEMVPRCSIMGNDTLDVSDDHFILN